MKLTTGMFRASQIPDLTNPPLGLRDGQMRSFEERVWAGNVGWFNKEGSLLGFGDLSAADMNRIADQLDEGELFIILGEMDTVDRPKWDGVEDYLVANARYAIAKGKVYVFGEWVGTHFLESTRIHGLQFELLSRGLLREMMMKK